MNDAVYGEDIADLDQAYEESKPAERGEFPSIPDGIYKCNVHEAYFKKSKTGNLMFLIVFEILDEKFAGQKIFKNYVLKPESLGFLKADLLTLGMVVKNLSELDQKSYDLLDTVAIVTLKRKTGSEFQNCYVNQLISRRSDDVQRASDDIPF